VVRLVRLVRVVVPPIYTCTYSEMRILQLIVSGTLANAGRPERVKNKKQTETLSAKTEKFSAKTEIFFCEF
jgi:hypothetical protein